MKPHSNGHFLRGKSVWAEVDEEALHLHALQICSVDDADLLVDIISTPVADVVRDSSVMVR